MAECREIGTILGAVWDGELEPDEMRRSRIISCDAHLAP
jgi:hypothetical protein